MPGGGYVVENGITLCDTQASPDRESCHQRVERAMRAYFSRDRGSYRDAGVFPFKLYRKVGSSYSRAIKAALDMERK